MIILENVVKTYPIKRGRKVIINNVSFVIPSGVNIGILGANGAGKSTLLRMLGGIEHPDSGRIITNKRISWPVALSGGFQGSMTGRQNVRFVCQIFGMNSEEVERKVKFVENFAEIGPYFDMPIKTYSSGMRARVSFGLSMAFDFDYYLVDEALSVGDRSFKDKAQAIIAEKREKSNFIVASHSMNRIKSVCDVAILLDQGTLTLFDDLNEAIKTYEGLGKKPIVKEPERAAGKNLGALIG